MRVRLIGIDAPERHYNQKARRDSDRSGLDVKTIEALGEKSAQYLGNLLKPGSKIKLVTDVTRTDKSGRLLAYAYSEDGTFINLKMIEDGYAHPYSIPPNVKYKSEFKDAARRAREKMLGLWKAQ